LRTSDDDVLRDLAAAAGDDLVQLVARAARATTADLFGRLAAAGYADIRLSHLPVFTGLEPGGSQITELAQRAGLSRQAMSVLVREVEAIGYIRLLPDPQDRRALRVELTAHGVAFCRAVIAASRELTEQLTRRWGAEAVGALRDRLGELPASLGG
jgi:DNA-binding MarR family transcriptional regulator